MVIKDATVGLIGGILAAISGMLGLATSSSKVFWTVLSDIGFANKPSARVGDIFFVLKNQYR